MSKQLKVWSKESIHLLLPEESDNLTLSYKKIDETFREILGDNLVDSKYSASTEGVNIKVQYELKGVEGVFGYNPVIIWTSNYNSNQKLLVGAGSIKMDNKTVFILDHNTIDFNLLDKGNEDLVFEEISALCANYLVEFDKAQQRISELNSVLYHDSQFAIDCSHLYLIKRVISTNQIAAIKTEFLKELREENEFRSFMDYYEVILKTKMYTHPAIWFAQNKAIISYFDAKYFQTMDFSLPPTKVLERFIVVSKEAEQPVIIAEEPVVEKTVVEEVIPEPVATIEQKEVTTPVQESVGVSDDIYIPCDTIHLISPFVEIGDTFIMDDFTYFIESTEMIDGILNYKVSLLISGEETVAVDPIKEEVKEEEKPLEPKKKPKSEIILDEKAQSFVDKYFKGRAIKSKIISGKECILTFDSHEVGIFQM